MPADHHGAVVGPTGPRRGRSSARFVCCFYSFKCHYPVCFPGLAFVIRECLFETGRIRRDVHETVSNKDHSVIELFLIDKYTTAIFKLPYRGYAQNARVAIGPIEAPLMGLGIVEPQADAFDMTCRTVGRELEQIGVAIQNLSDD